MVQRTVEGTETVKGNRGVEEAEGSRGDRGP
jgi:hypothetical protein